MTRGIVVIALVAAAAACAGGTGGPPAGGAAPATTARRNPNVITRDEIDQATWATNAFDLVQRLRPNFLRVTGPTSWSGAAQTSTVRVNDQEYGEAGALRQIQPSSIQEIRYYSASEATAKYGTRGGRPVIAVTTRS